MTSIPQIASCLRNSTNVNDTSNARAASLPPIAVLEDRSCDADDEGDGDDEVVSLREIYSRDLPLQPALNLAQRLATPPPAIKVPKPLDLFGPLSPLSELTPSEDEEEPAKPISKQDDTKVGKSCASDTSSTSTPSSLKGKRKRSSSVTSIPGLSDEPPSKKHTSARPLSSVQDKSDVSVDAVHPPKRCGVSTKAPVEQSISGQASSSRSLTLAEIRKSLRRHAKTFGRIRKSKSASKQKVRG